MSARHTLCLVALAVGCGGSVQVTTDLVPELELDAARREAPDLVRAAEAARDEARAAAEAGDEDAARDHATIARLYAEAAVTEAERAQMERDRVDALHQMEEDARVAAELDATRDALEREERRQAAVAIARAQMQAAFEQAEQDEPRRHRRRATALQGARASAARAFAERTRLLLAAAEELAPQRDPEIERVRAALDAMPDPLTAQHLGDVRALHEDAAAALGRARAAAPVSPLTLASLREAATERGLEPAATEGGTELRAAEVEGRLRLARLVPLLVAFPHGQIVLRGARARAQASALRRELRTPGRLRVEAGEGATIVVLTGYRAE